MMERIMFSICRKARHGNEPKYYICARRDNGFIPAYRAYFFIKGNKIKRVSCMRYEHSVTFGKRADDIHRNGRSGRTNTKRSDTI